MIKGKSWKTSSSDAEIPQALPMTVSFQPMIRLARNGGVNKERDDLVVPFLVDRPFSIVAAPRYPY